jgi:hypothetical protein
MFKLLLSRENLLMGDVVEKKLFETTAELVLKNLTCEVFVPATSQFPSSLYIAVVKVAPGKLYTFPVALKVPDENWYRYSVMLFP